MPKHLPHFQLHKISAKELVLRINDIAPDNSDWVFDCDGTLITGDIASHTAWMILQNRLAAPEMLPPEWTKHHEKPHFDLEDYHLMRDQMLSRMTDVYQLYNWECFVQSGHPHASIVQISKHALDAGLKKNSITFTEPIARLAQDKAHKSWVVSGSPKPSVEAVAAHLSVAPERVLATELEMVDGIFAPRYSGLGLIWEKTKQTALENNNVHQPFFVAGDTIGDWHMFDMASGFAWVVIWDNSRFRGEQTRKLVNERVLAPHGTFLPHESGTYLFPTPDKYWVFEVKTHPGCD